MIVLISVRLLDSFQHTQANMWNLLAIIVYNRKVINSRQTIASVITFHHARILKLVTTVSAKYDDRIFF